MTVTATTLQPRHSHRALWAFARHYLEMIVAMLVGMATLYPLYKLTTSGAWAERVDVSSLAMATAMTIPMVAWMRLKMGHGWAACLEMAAAMYLGFAVFLPFHWWGGLGEMGVMMGGHIAMPIFMLLAMLARYSEYTHHH